MKDFDFQPKPEHKGTGKCCPTLAQYEEMKRLTTAGEKWRVRIKNQGGVILAAYWGSREMLATATLETKGKDHYWLMEYFTSY